MPLPLLIAAALAQGAPAAAALSPEAADARCVVILGFIGQQPGQTAPRIEAVKTGSAYYLGKLRGRNPRINLPTTLAAAAQRAQAQKVNVAAESQRCGNELTALAATARSTAATPRKP